MKKIFSKTLSIIISTVILLSAVSVANIFTVSADTTDSMVYPGGQVRVTYSFVKDIPEGVPCYLINSDYDANSLKFADIENYWVSYPVCVPHAEYISFNVAVAMGPTVKAGDKMAGLIFDVIEPVDINSLNFDIWELQLYNNAGDDLMENETPSAYVGYNVEVISRGEEPTTEPETTAPVEEPETTEPVTTEPKILYGDVDGDGIISIQDATEIQKFGVGINTPEIGSDLFEIADVNDDGRISILDVTCIQKYLVGGYEDTGLLGK